MRATALHVALLCLALFAAPGCADDGAPQDDPCAGVVCLRGQDCVAGACVDRPDPEPEGCTSNEDCLFHPMGELCDRGSGLCVACFTDSHCPAGRSCEAGRCAGSVCTTDDDCGEDAPHCNEAGDACLACLEAAHCEEGATCEAGVCVPVVTVCETDEHCEEEEAPFCVAGACVGCRDDGDCGDREICGAGGVCEPVHCTETSGCDPWEVCVDGAACAPRPCDDLLDCPVGSLCVDAACAPPAGCAEDEPCLDPRAPHCSEGACHACVTNDHCGPWEQCREGACAPFDTCRASADCKGGFVCVAEVCVACSADAHCPRGSCVAGACVDAEPCASDAQCAFGVCADGLCVGCASDLDCAEGSFCEAGACVCEGAGCDPMGCEDDGYEPDGGPAQARPLALRSPESRTLCAGDEDWFVFTGAAGAAIQASLIQGADGLEVALVWFDDDAARERRERVGAAGTWAGILPPAATGRYYVVVRSAGGSGPYTLLVEPQTSCTDPYEPNDSFANASPLEAGVLVEDLRPCGPGDFYSLEVPADHALTATAFFAAGVLDLHLFDEGGSRIPGAAVSTEDRGGGVRLAIPPAPADRKVVLRVFTPGAATPPSDYALHVAVEGPAACGEDEELISLGAERGRVRGANLGVAATHPSACGTLEHARTHRIHLDEPRRLQVEVDAEFSPRLAILDDRCGGEVACLEGPVLDVAQLPAGSYVLAVASAGGQGLYDLAARLLPPLVPPTNDRCDQPEPLALGAGPVAGTTTGAAPDVATGCGSPSPDVFYDLTLQDDGRVVVEADGAVSLFLTGDDCAPLPGACGERRLDLELPAGSYRLGVASPSGRGVDFEVAAQLVTTPANDACAAATPIARGSTIWGDTTWASNGQTYPIAASCTGYLLDGGDVFHSIQLAGGVPVTFTVTPDEGYDVALYVMDGCATRQCLAGVDAGLRGERERLVFTPPADGTYVIVVDGAAGGGTFALEVD